jgi:hypothetical protein
MRNAAIAAGIALSIAFPRDAGATTYSGWVDYLGQDRISGWACVANAASALPVWVHIYDGATYVTSTPANSEYRPDAAWLCGGPSWTGFSVATPKLSVSGNHTINVYVSTSRNPSTVNRLPGATTLVYGYPFTGSNTFGVVESITPTSIVGWACDRDSPAAQLTIPVRVQYYGRGPIYSLTSGVTTISRPDVAPVCGSGTNKGFQISLPPLPGGNHNIIASAVNIGPGAMQTLNKYSTLPALSAFPYEASSNLDPGLQYAANCWYGAANISRVYNNLSGCQTGFGSWQLGVSDTLNLSTLQRDTPSAPLSPYWGPFARVRYQPTSSAGGFTMLADTWDSPTSGQILHRCDYNFQAFGTNMNEVNVNSIHSLALEATVTLRDDGNLLFDPTNATDGTGCSNAIEMGSNPWLQLILAAVFQTGSASNSTLKTYFVEVVPFWEAGFLTGRYPVFPEFPGNDKPYLFNTPAQYTAADPQNTGGGIGGHDSPGYLRVGRLATTDERIRDFIKLPSPMAPGETRQFYIDLLRTFQAIFPNVDINAFRFTGGYVGTEQFNKARLGFDMTRLSFITH